VSVTSSNTVCASVSKQLGNSIKAEFSVFENSGTRERSLEQVYAYLLTVPAASVKAERTFQQLGSLRQKWDHVSVIPCWTCSASYVQTINRTELVCRIIRRTSGRSKSAWIWESSVSGCQQLTQFWAAEVWVTSWKLNNDIIDIIIIIIFIRTSST